MARIDKGIVRASARIQLRPFRRADYQAYVALDRENERWLAPWVPTPPPDRYSKGRFVEQLRAAGEGARSGTYFRFGIFSTGEDMPMGAVSVSGVHYGALWSCYIGYWVGEAFAGRGIMTEALCLVLDFIFGDLSLHRAQISIMPHNERSRRVVEKLGLREEGIAVRYLKIAGEWCDHIRYAILADEYFERKEDLFLRFVRTEGP